MTALWIYGAGLVGFLLGVGLMCLLQVGERPAPPPPDRAWLASVPLFALIFMLALGIGLCIGLIAGAAA